MKKTPEEYLKMEVIVNTLALKSTRQLLSSSHFLREKQDIKDMGSDDCDDDCLHSK